MDHLPPEETSNDRVLPIINFENPDDIARVVHDVAANRAQARFTEHIASDRYRFTPRGISYFYDRQRAGESPVTYDDLRTHIAEGVQQREEETAWVDVVTVAPDEDSMVAALDVYASWVDATQRYKYYAPARSLSPYRMLGAVEKWMTDNKVPIDAKGAIPAKIRELFLTGPMENDDRRMTVRSAIAWKANQEYSNPLVHAAVGEGGSMYMLLDETNRNLAEFTAGMPVRFRKDGEALEAFRQRCDDVKWQPGRHGSKLEKSLNPQVSHLVTDTLALIAVSGGEHAAKLWRALQAQAHEVGLGSNAKQVPIPAIIKLANILTNDINKRGGVDIDGERKKLIALEQSIDSLPEAFRRLLYVSLDLDPSVDSVKADLIDVCDIEERVDASEKYIDARQQYEKHQTQRRRPPAVGKTAVRAIRGDIPPGPSGERVYPPARLYMPGYGRLS